MTNFDLSKVNITRIFDGLGLSEKKIGSNVDIAIKKTSKWAHSQIVRELSKTTGIKQKDIRKRVFHAKSRKYTHSSYVSLYVRPMNLARFKARQTKRGLTSRVMSVPGAFLATMPGGHMKIAVKREGRRRLPIEPVTFNIRRHVQAAADRVWTSRNLMPRLYKEIKERRRMLRAKAGLR